MGQHGQNQGPDIWAWTLCFRNLAETLVLCLKRIGSNFFFCGGYSSWVHKKCSGVSGHLKSDASFRCKRCTGQARPINGRPMTEVTVDGEKLEVVPSFCCLGDCLSSGGSCERTSMTRCRVAWGKYNDLLPGLTSCPFPITSRRRIMIPASGAPCSMQANLGPNLF